MERPYGISDFAFPTRWDRESGPDLAENAGRSSQSEREHGQAERDNRSDSGGSNRGDDGSRTIYRGQDREYSLRASEERTLTDIGNFRVVPAGDLARFGYQGNRAQMEGDVRNLSRHGLVEQRTIEGHCSYSTRVLTLTKDVQRLLQRVQLVSNRQATYHGLVKPKEARHDADVYRLYQKVSREIERSGGKVRRVVLDFELKKDLYQELSRMRPDKDPRYERIFIANQFDLKVVDGKIPIPDLRIEYEDDCSDVHRRDLEIATRDYRPQGLGEKAKTGFHIFARPKEYLRHGRVFHLFSRNLYEAIGRENVRFRRVHSTEYIRTRLIALNFILRNQDFALLESEEQTLVFFCDQMGIDKKILPHKRYAGAIKDQHTDRYFVDKFLMFYNPSFSFFPVATFSFIDPGFESMDSFKTHLNAYLTLFTTLPKLRLYCVATRDTNFKRAEKIFQGVFHRLWDPDSPSGLLDYFRTSRKWDDKQYDKVGNHDMIFVNEAKERFRGDGIEDFYRKWRGEQFPQNAIRSEYGKLKTPSEACIIFATVNGQAALFERHPYQPVHLSEKSSEEAGFPGDFTSNITPAWR